MGCTYTSGLLRLVQLSTYRTDLSLSLGSTEQAQRARTQRVRHRRRKAALRMAASATNFYGGLHTPGPPDCKARPFAVDPSREKGIISLLSVAAPDLAAAQGG